MLRARGDFDRANEDGVHREKRVDPRDTVGELRRVANLTRTPPANPATRLVEAIVNGEDIRRPHEIPAGYPVPALHAALAYQLKTSTSFGGSLQRAHGFRLTASDTGRTWGDCADVEGTATDILMQVSGRAVSPGRFSGEVPPA